MGFVPTKPSKTDRTGRPDQADRIALTEDELREITGFAADCAARVLHLFEQSLPADPRPREAIEAAITGREIECGVLEFEDGPRASLPAEIPPPDAHAYYDFEAKYIDSTPGIVPAPLTEEETAEIRRLAVDAFEAASCEGLVRADFFLTEDGEFVINEINTLPGFTPISMYPQMWQATGVGYPELIDLLVQAALRRSTGLR
ncbi:putative immunity protein [Streptomyces sp. SID685]|uniref:putative immunity protein n=1 Tax=Streptomyces sp. SID685 TaxID=2690322 RepID=UPI0031FE7A90